MAIAYCLTLIEGLKDLKIKGLMDFSFARL
jgi:hypothetical protein